VTVGTRAGTPLKRRWNRSHGYPAVRLTLRDLVSCDTRHNEGDSESNRGGTDDNRSWNCGAGASPTTRRSTPCGGGRNGLCYPPTAERLRVPRRRAGPQRARRRRARAASRARADLAARA